MCWQDCKTDGAEKHTSEKNKQNGGFYTYGDEKTSSPMGNDRSPGGQHNVWRRHNLGCSKAGNSELETVIRNKFKHSRYYASSDYQQVLKRSE